MLAAFSALALHNQRKDVLPLNLKKLPISELHVHAEGGTLDQETLNYLAARHNRKPPVEIYGPKNMLKFKEGDFLDFLRVYDIAASFIEDEDDISEVIYRYLKRCHEEGAIYIEMTCSPDHLRKMRKTFTEVHQEFVRDKLQRDVPVTAAASAEATKETKEGVLVNNLSYPAIVAAIARGIDRARAEFGIEARIIMVLLRHNRFEACMRMVQEIVSHPHPYVVGINMAGDELHCPAEDYRECYALAKRHGLRLTAHVGEHARAEVMQSAIESLQLDRIGHGVNCIYDRKLMQLIKERGIGLEICLTSNVELKVFPSLTVHPFKALFDFGLKCSLSSDDPTYFGSSLGEEYRKAQIQWDLSFDEMIQLCKNSIEMSFAEPTLKHKLMCQIALYEAFHLFRDDLESGALAATKCAQKVAEYEEAPCDRLADQIKTFGLEELPESRLLMDFYDKHQQFQRACSTPKEEVQEEVKSRVTP